MLSSTDIIMLQHGNKKEYKIIKPSKELILLGKELDKLKEGKIVLKVSNLNSSKKESETFMKSHFNIHQILHQDGKVLDEYLSRHEFRTATGVARVYKNLAKKIDPYKLPIKTVDGKDCRFAELEEISPNCSMTKVISKSPIIFQGIKMTSLITDCTSSILSHEITHSQIDSHKGITQSYYNHEVIPMFIQLVENFEKDPKSLEIDQIFRLLEISGLIESLEEYHYNGKYYSDDDLFDITKYLESAMKSFLLFEVYINANKSEQRAIFDFIQKIFDGKKTVEELLEIYNITLKRSSKLLQKKYLK